ncbi:MAG: ABC transporter permease [Gemmatimonadetes bacterium]|nr:ABC transporter permease [Gemmatimonadota bacterium]
MTTSGPGPRPPRLGRLLLRLFAPGGLRQEIEGDLTEAWRRDKERVGSIRAGVRFVREAASPSLIRLRRQTRGMDLAPGTPLRARNGESILSALRRDLSYAIRLLTRTPGFATVVILSLALGIGPNTAIFSIVNGLFFRDRGVAEPDTLVEIWEMGRDGRLNYTYYSVYEDILEGTTDVFSDVAVYAPISARLEGDLGAAPILGELVSANFFHVLGVGASVGRTFLPEEGVTPGTHPVTVLSDRLFRQRFGSDPSVVGESVRINGRSYTVVGVADPTFRGKMVPGLEVDLWVPMMMYPHLKPNQMTSNGDVQMTGRLHPGTPPARAMAALDAVAARIDEEWGDSRFTFALGSYVLADYYFSPDMDGVITAMAALLFAVVGLVLLVACVNLAGFFLARATDRRREMSIRVAMGAGQGAILRQLLVESLVLAAVGGLIGLALGHFLVRFVTRIDFPLPMPVTLDLGLDGRVLAFTAFVTIGAGLLFGLVPALRASRAPVATMLRDESASAGGRGKTRARNIMVAAQMALSMILLVGAGLFLRSFRSMAAIDVGFDTGPAAILNVDAASTGYEPEAMAGLYENIEREIRNNTLIQDMGLASRLPLALGNVNRGFEIPGVAPPENGDFHLIELNYVTAPYFEVMGIELLQGRNFTTADDTTGAPVVIVSQAAAQRYWPGEDPTGRIIHAPSNPERSWSVVGVAADAKIWTVTEAPRAYLYFPVSQAGAPGIMNFVARGGAPPDILAREMAEAARRVDPDLFIVDAGTMSEHLQYSRFLPQTAALLVGAFAALALTLASVGLWGIVSYGVSRRTRELGIRISLGAERSRITRLVMQAGLVSVGVGALIGLVGAVVAARLVERFLIGVGGWDPITFVAVPLVLAGVAFLAAYLPARRANRVDPIEALRAD